MSDKDKKPPQPFDWLSDKDAFTRRFVLAEVLGPPRGARPRLGPRPPRPR